MIRYWNEFGVHKVAALKSAVYTYDPQAIVLGGSLAKAYNLFKASMHNSWQDFAFPESIKRLKIFRSQNEHITLLGASALIQQGVTFQVKVS